MIKLDLKDRKILYALDLNSRATLGEISKEVKLSKQVVDYRIKNLIKNKVIKHFYTITNFSKLGYTEYKLYLKFQNVDVAKEKEIIDFWVDGVPSFWVGSCRGRWDLAVAVSSRDINEFGDILNSFINKYGIYVLEKDVLITEVSPVFTRNYLTGKKEKKVHTFGGKIGNYELDNSDIKILRLISMNARMTVSEIMEKSGLTRDVINYRIKKLRKDDIISQYRVLIDLDVIGYKLYKIILRLRSLTPEKEKKLISYITLHPKGTQYLKLVGSWDAELEFEVQNEEELHSILLDIRNNFSDIIRDYDTLLVYKEHKLNYLPF